MVFLQRRMYSLGQNIDCFPTHTHARTHTKREKKGGETLLLDEIIYSVRIQQCAVLLVMKEVVAFDAEVAGVIQSPLIVDRHLRREIDLADRALLQALLQLECLDRVFSLVVCVIWVDQPHVPYHDRVLAVPLKMCNKVSETWLTDLISLFCCRPSRAAP